MKYAQFMVVILLSPLLQGVIRKLKAGMQGRVGPGVLQTYYDLLRLFKKDMVVSDVTSWVFKAAPYMVFASSLLAAMLVPVLTTKSPLVFMGDVIALIYEIGRASCRERV